MYAIDRSESLAHHGIKGQRWGVRRKGYVAKGIYQKHPDGYDYNDNRNKLSGSRNFREGTNISEYKKQLAVQNQTNSQVNKNKVNESRDNGKKIVSRLLLGGLVGVGIGAAIDKKKAKKEAEANKAIESKDTVKKIQNDEATKNGKKIIGRLLLGGLIGAGIGAAIDKKKSKNATSQNKTNKLEISDSDTEVTKKVKKDYNKLSDKEFMQKYQTTKKVYAKRVEKYGDPYARRMRR